MSLSAATPAADDPDALYARRADLAAARAAFEIWADRLGSSRGRDFESAWKLSRAAYWIGTHGESPEIRRSALERGIDSATSAIRTQPKRPEGHFWRAANMGALAESFGLRMGLKYRGAIKSELETVLMIDPAFQDGSADRALGRWYYRVPGLFGGSKKKSEEHLRRSLAYDANSHASLYFLAETLLAMDRDAEARAALERTLAAPIHPEWAPEDEDFKAKARELLARMKN